MRAQVSHLVVFWWTRKPSVSSSFHVALSSVSWGPKNCRHTFVPRVVRSVGRFDHVRLCILCGGGLCSGGARGQQGEAAWNTQAVGWRETSWGRFSREEAIPWAEVSMALDRRWRPSWHLMNETLIFLKLISLKINTVIEERHRAPFRMLVVFYFLNQVMGTQGLILVFIFHVLLSVHYRPQK